MSITIDSADSTAAQAARELLRKSSLYHEFQAERKEILRHKWIESETAGRDIGLESAVVNWVVHHRAQWRRTRRGQAGALPV